MNNDKQQHRITMEFDGYNAKRYSSPWLAKVINWPVGEYPQLKFGAYLGGQGGGECEIMAAIGDVVKYGQKDRRRNFNMNEFGIVRDDLTIERVTMSVAKKHYLNNNNNSENES